MSKIDSDYRPDPLISQWRRLSATGDLAALRKANPANRPDVVAMLIAQNNGHAEVAKYWEDECGVRSIRPAAADK